MSDTHDSHDKIQELPPGDIFIHAGDFTQYCYRGQLDRFRQFLEKLPYKHKIVIAGNHDFVLDHTNYETKHKPKRHKYEKMNSLEEIKKIKQICTYLQHQSVEVEGLRIFGSPYQPLFYNWAFQYHPTRAEEYWSAIPKNIDILVTHGPPFGILDQAEDGVHAGCPTLLKYVQEIKPKVHIYGHLHNSHGQKELDGTRYFNVSMMNEKYEIVNKPTVIEIVRQKS